MSIKQIIRSIALAALSWLPILSTANDFRLHSEDLRQGDSLAMAQVFDGFGCAGENRSPAISWSFAPANTKSFVVIMYDPDASTGSGWWHWLVYNIPGGINEIAWGAGALNGTALPKDAKMGRNDFGVHAYGGACPPLGRRVHRYLFSVHALKIEKIDLPADASAAMIGFMIHSNSISTTRTVMTFARPAVKLTINEAVLVERPRYRLHEVRELVLAMLL